MSRVARKIVALVLGVLLLSAGFAMPALGEESDNRVIKVGVFAFDGYHMEDEDGNLTGYGIELLELIERYSHLEMELVGYDRSWADMLDMLEAGEIDMVTSARQTPEREEQFAFSMPVGSNKTVLSVAEGNRRVVGGNYSTYDGMRVGLIEGSSQNDKLEAYAEKHGFYYEPVLFEDSDELTEALAAGTIDAILTSNLRRGENERVIGTVDEDAFYAIVRKDDTALLDEINYALEEIDLHEGDWRNVLTYRYYGAEYAGSLEFTEREQAYIDQVRSGEKVINVTAMVDRMPYSYVEDGMLRGILLDYFAAVMDVAELPYNVVTPFSADGYMELVDRDGVDVVIDAIVTDGEFATDGNEFSGFNTSAYMETGFAVVTGPGFDGDVETVAVGDPQTERIVGDYTPDSVTVVRYPTTAEAMQAVADGKADAAYVYSYSAQQIINRDSASSLHFSLVHDLNTRFAMYVSDSVDHELVTILDKCIQRVPQSKLDQIISEYTSYGLHDLTFEEFLRANPGLVGIAGLAVVLVAAVIVGLYARGRWNKRLLRAEEESNRELGEQLAIVDALSRDYTNVFSVNANTGMVRIVKLEGYVTEGLKKDADIEYDYDAILSNYIDARVHPDERARLARDLSLGTVTEALAKSEEYLGVYRILIEDGIHHYQYSFTVVERNDGTSFILAGFRNIDEVIRDEQKQKEILSEALAQAQYANRAKTTFLNSMSHDIRTPMNAIIGFTALAGSHLDNPEQVRDYLSKIMTSSNHLLSLINDVLDMSRIESGKVQIEENETNLLQVTGDLRTIVQTDVRAKHLEFSMDTAEVHNAVVICDKLRLNQVLLNVLSNAMKYTNPGGRVGVRVVQTAEVVDGFASYEFRVKDTGIGMGEEFLKHVFEPFERENTATVTGIEGTGLGLAITKNIVDMMGGTISVESEVGLGSEFTVNFRFRVVEDPEESQSADGLPEPLCAVKAEEAEEEPGAAEAPAAAEEKPDFAGKKILLVEDNELNLEIAQAILEKEGFVVFTADDGVVAVEMMEQNPAGTYDLVLTDVQMPLMDGYEETRRIRALDDEAKASIPIVAMTANAFSEDRAKAEEAGMNDYVCKPINVKKLMEVLAQHL